MDESWVKLSGTSPLSDGLSGAELAPLLPQLAPPGVAEFGRRSAPTAKKSIDSEAPAGRSRLLRLSVLPEAAPAAGRRRTQQQKAGGISVREVPPTRRRDWPYCAIGRLLVRFAGTQQIRVGSATIIAPDVLLTAAHNAFDSQLGGFAEAIEFQPGFDDSPGGAGGAPWIVSDAIPHAAWQRRQDFRYDFALLRVRQQSNVGIHKRFGALGVRSRLRSGAGCELIGYPVGAPYRGNEMMLALGGAARADPAFSADQPLSAECRLGEGMSGGPWFEHPPGSGSQDVLVRGLTSYSRSDGRLYSPWFGSVFESFIDRHLT